MADATAAAVVGGIGIVTSGIIGPLVAAHIAKDRENRQDLRAALDAAMDAAGQAYATYEHAYAAINVTGGDLEAFAHDTFNANAQVAAWWFKLTIRLGEDHEICKAYRTLLGALKGLESYVAAHAQQQGSSAPMPDEVGLHLEENRHVAEDAYQAGRKQLIHAAHKLFGDAGMSDM